MTLKNDEKRIKELVAMAIVRHRDEIANRIIFGDGMDKKYTVAERFKLIDDLLTYSDDAIEALEKTNLNSIDEKDHNFEKVLGL